MGDTLHSPLSTRLSSTKLVLIPTLVGLNLVMGWVVAAIKLPIFLDSIGITIAAILAGPWIAIAVGVATTLIGTVLFSPVLYAFSGSAAAIGIASYLLAQRGFYQAWWKAIIAGLIIAVVAAVVSAPVSAIMFGGSTGGGVDAVTLFFRNAGNSIMKSVFLSGASSELIDKSLVSFLAYVLVHRLSRRTVAWFPGADRRIRKTVPPKPAT
jgi:energy-coupling factor transport system substrate-specific component